LLGYFYKDDYATDPHAYDKHLNSADTAEHLAALRDRLVGAESFDRAEIERITRELAEELDVKAADLIHPCRVALTGRSVSPDIFSVMHLLGQKKSTERLDGAVEHISAAAGK